MKLQLLDELISLGHGNIRSTDCLIAVNLPPGMIPDPERAQKVFPKTSKFPIKVGEFSRLEDFAVSNLPSHFHLEVAIIREEIPLLALKMSHVLGDAVSMLLFLKVMLGKEEKDEELVLKTFPKKKDTPYRDLLTSKLWPRKGKPGYTRKFLRATLEHGETNAPVLNDLMLYSLLEALPFSRKSIWVPVNVRKNFWKGFGNGLSRLRIYPPKGATLEEKLAHIRKQKQEALRNGEVALPPPEFDLQNRHHRLLYDLWINRPWADWSSISLSHLSGSQGFLESMTKVWGLSNLMPHHQTAIFAVTNNDHTDFTMTFDDTVVKIEEAEYLLNTFISHLRKKL